MGFEQECYTVNEMDGEQEVCVVVINPSPDEELLFDIALTIERGAGTAGRAHIYHWAKN